jgi:hypothetical protein
MRVEKYYIRSFKYTIKSKIKNLKNFIMIIKFKNSIDIFKKEFVINEDI